MIAASATGGSDENNPFHCSYGSSGFTSGALFQEAELF